MNLEGDEYMNRENVRIMKDKESKISLDENNSGREFMISKKAGVGDNDDMEDCCDEANNSGLSEIQ